MEARYRMGIWNENRCNNEDEDEDDQGIHVEIDSMSPL